MCVSVGRARGEGRPGECEKRRGAAGPKGGLCERYHSGRACQYAIANKGAGGEGGAMSRTLKDMSPAVRARRRRAVISREQARRRGRRGLMTVITASKVFLIGNLGRAVELRDVGGGRVVGKTIIAVSRVAPGGEKKGTDWIPVVLWDRQATNAARYLRGTRRRPACRRCLVVRSGSGTSRRRCRCRG